MSIPLFKVFMAPEVMGNIQTVIESGVVTQGPVVEKYEQALSEYFNTENIVTVNSATSGLTLGLRLLNSLLPPDSEVLCTPLTCTATNWPVLANNMKIKWVDVDPNTCNMDLNDLKHKLTKDTRVVLFVHWGGYPIDMIKLNEIKHYYWNTYHQVLYIIEDCAHAFGSKILNKKVGSLNICCMSIFSTQAIKHLTTVDGGFMIINYDDLYQRARRLRWFGIDRNKRTTSTGDFRLEPDVPEWGYKFHMNDLNASIGLANLKYVDSNLEKIRTIANYYNKELGKINGVKLLHHVDTSEPSYWIYTIKIVNKSEFITFMNNNGVMCSQVHHRNDTHSCVSEFKTNLPSLDKLEKDIVCIPCGWWMNLDDAMYITNLIKEWCEKQVVTSNNIHIRELNIHDNYNEFISLITQLNKQSPENYSYNMFKERLELANRLGHYIYIAEIEIDGIYYIIGTAKLIIEPKFFHSLGHIEDVVIDINYRYMNIGKQLIHHILNIGFDDYRCYKIVLNANENVSNFYKKCDFDYEKNNISQTYRMII